MHNDAQTIARLKSIGFLIGEALRIADESHNAMLGAKLSDCIDCVNAALSDIDVTPSTGAAATIIEPFRKRSVTLQI